MKPPRPPQGPAGTWRVVVARLPEGRVSDPGDGDGRLLVHHIPVLEHATWPQVAELVERLRGMGAAAAVYSEDGVCSVHPTELAGSRCTTCETWICGQCRADARGAALCAACARKSGEARRLRRLRSLFSVFLFTVFLYQVASYLKSEAAALEPPVRVVIVQFAPARLIGDPRLRALNQPDGGAGRSLYDLASFYQQEYTRYTGSSQPFLDVTLRGPWAVDVDPPALGERDAPWWQLLVTSWQYPRYFHALARQQGVDPDAFGARMYVVWTDSPNDITGDSRGSQKGRIGITWLSVDEPNLAYSVVGVAHELGHILGAVDNYDESNYLAHWPEGYVEPFATPLWPQSWAELMAVDRPSGPTLEEEVQSLFEERIGYDTAASIGWIAKEQAELYYEPRLTMPEEVLHQLERNRATVRARPQSIGPKAESMNADAIVLPEGGALAVPESDAPVLPEDGASAVPEDGVLAVPEPVTPALSEGG